MTNQLALWIGLLLIGAALLDWALTGGATLVAGARLFHEIIVSMRFWR
jgi:hypothetical protein